MTHSAYNKASDDVLSTRRRSEHTDLLWRTGMSTSEHISRHARRQPKAIETRLLDRTIRTPSGCWEWQGAKTLAGYGKMYANQKCDDTHRISYRLFCGPIPDGVYVCHRCDNPPCVNPNHLFLGTPTENQADMRMKRRARNPKGSEAWKAKICEADVVRIRQQFADGRPRKQIAREFGLSETTISHIARGKIWKHVPGAVPARANGHGGGRRPC